MQHCVSRLNNLADAQLSARHHKRHNRSARRSDSRDLLRLTAFEFKARHRRLLANHILALPNHNNRDICTT